jgi:hypothetical protein
VFLPSTIPGLSTRLVLLRAALVVACALTLLASAPLWLNTRPFPVLPIAGWFPVLSSPWDRIIFIAVLASLMVSGWRYRTGVVMFLAGSLFLALGDQSRWQPWFYMYWVMLALTLAKDPAAATTACRVALCVVYFWSGVQKLNPHYFDLVVPWFVKPAAAWLPSPLVSAAQWAVAAAPVIEIFISLGLWFSRTRSAAVVVACMVHLGALLFLGPVGHEHNWIIWPWNLVMPALVLILFPAGRPAEGWGNLRRSGWSVAAVGLFALLPVLSFFGKWDSYLSFSLYTGHLSKADIFISAAVRDRLPPEVQAFARPTPPPYNEQLQGPYVVLTELWADSVLKVPPLPEARNYRNVARYLAGFASDPNDVRMVLIPRVGKILFYGGSDLRPEAGIPLNL